MHRYLPRRSYDSQAVDRFYGPGTAGNVLAALASLFVPGLGQLLQGRPWLALFQFVLATLMWVALLGWIVHLWSIINAARYIPYEPYERARRLYYE